MSAGVVVSRRRIFGAAGGAVAAGGLLTAAGPAMSLAASAGADEALIAACKRIADLENFIDEFHAVGPRTIEAEDARNAAMEPVWVERERTAAQANAMRAATLAGVRARVATLRRWAPNFWSALSDSERGMLTALCEEICGGELT